MIRSTSHRQDARSAGRPSSPIHPATLVMRDGRRVELIDDPVALDLQVDGQHALRMVRRAAGLNSLSVSLPLEAGAEHAFDVLMLAAAALFSRHDLREIELAVHGGAVLLPLLQRSGLATMLSESGDVLHVRIASAPFWQRPGEWLGPETSAGFPLSYAMTGDKRHPRRPPRAEGVVYRRFVPALGCVVAFRTLDIGGDLDAFHRWMNEPRVAAFWELAGTRETHADYLARVLTDPHVHPVIGLFDDQPFGYFELYWAKEDRIAPFYPVDDYDRGLHMLVGEERFRGPARVAAWLTSLVHYLFLDEPRTRRVVAEPRADNQKMIQYLLRVGFFQRGEFDFPHKRAAMMMVPRETFFEQFGARSA